MVGKMTFNNIVKSLILSTLCLISSCRTSLYYQQDISAKNVSGTYVFNQIGNEDEIVERDTLVLEENGTYYFRADLKYKDLSEMDIYPTYGVWKISGDKIILNSIFPCSDDSCFIKEIELDTMNEDWAIIEMIQLSTGLPMNNYTVLSIYDERYDSIANTDCRGRAIFRREHTSAIDISDPNGKRIVSLPRKGFMYRAYYRDCYLRIHNDEELFFQKGTLLMREKGVVGYNKLGMKKYKTYEYPFVKVSDSTGLQEAPF